MTEADLGPLADPIATTFEDHTRLFRIAFRRRFGPNKKDFAAETAEVESLYASGAPIEVIDALYPFPLLELLQGITPYREQEPWHSLLIVSQFTYNYYLPFEMWEILPDYIEAAQRTEYNEVERLIPPTKRPGEVGPAQPLYHADGSLTETDPSRGSEVQQNIRLNRTLFDILWYLTHPEMLTTPLMQMMALLGWDELYCRTATPPIIDSTASTTYRNKLMAMIEGAYL